MAPDLPPTILLRWAGVFRPMAAAGSLSPGIMVISRYLATGVRSLIIQNAARKGGAKVATGKQSITKQCPVTGGMPLKCTERGFWEACQKYRQNLKLQTGTRSEYCAICQGKVPGEVIFMQLKDAKSGVLKAMSESEKKNCYLCGEEKNLKAQYGQEVCSYCQIVRLQAKNRPDVLIKALQGFQQVPDDFHPDEPSDQQEEIDRLRTELSVARSALLSGAGQESVPSLKAELLAANRKLEAANLRILQLEQMDGRSLDLIRLQELAWKFAEGVMSGEVVGVEVEDIRLLRGVQ